MAETSKEWKDRMMKETEGMTKPIDILEHLANDVKKNGPPPQEDEQDG